MDNVFFKFGKLMIDCIANHSLRQSVDAANCLRDNMLCLFK